MPVNIDNIANDVKDVGIVQYDGKSSIDEIMSALSWSLQISQMCTMCRYNLCEHAKLIESDLYVLADLESEYPRLIVEKVESILNDIVEKRQQFREQFH